MKKIHLLAICLCVSLFCSCRSYEKDIMKRDEQRVRSRFVVTEHGVVGDGKTDSSQALQKLFDLISTRHQNCYNRRMPVGAYPEVVFPAGVYAVSEPIMLPKYVKIVGQGEVVIKQLHPNKDIFYVHWGNRFRIFNMKFSGGRRQLRIFSNNSDGMFMVVNCKFENASEYGLQNVIWREVKKGDSEQRNATGKIVGTYTRDRETGKMIEIPEKDAGLWYNSSFMSVIGCDFEGDVGAIDSNVDTLVIEKCRFKVKSLKTDSVIKCAARSKLTRCEFRSDKPVNPRACWIRPYSGTTVCEKLDVRMTNGVMPLVTNSVKYHGIQKGIHAVISVNDCEFSFSPHNSMAIVLCEKIPNVVVVENSSCDSGSIRAIDIVAPGQLDDLPQKATTSLLAFILDNNNKNIITNLPERLRRFTEKGVPKQIVEKYFSKGQAWNNPCLKQELAWMREEDGVIPGDRQNGEVDDHDRIHRAIRRALRVSGGDAIPHVTLNGDIYVVDKPIWLPPKIRLDAIGQAVIRTTDPSSPIFICRDSENVSISSISVVGGSNQFDFQPDSSKPFSCYIQYCFFWDSFGTSVRCMAVPTASESGSLSNSELYIDHSSFCGTYAFNYVTTCVPTWISNSYVTTGFIEKSAHHKIDACVFLAKDRFFLINNLMVPIVKTRHTSYRWLDARGGHAYCDFVRFGGEYGGMNCVNVPLGAPLAEVMINASCVFAKNHQSNRAVVHLAREPKVVIIKDCDAAEDFFEEIAMVRINSNQQRGSKKLSTPKWLFEAGNTVTNEAWLGAPLAPIIE